MNLNEAKHLAEDYCFNLLFFSFRASYNCLKSYKEIFNVVFLLVSATIKAIKLFKIFELFIEFMHCNSLKQKIYLDKRRKNEQ